jgi:tetratricopeptide (TPR) repeat protein
VRWVRRHRRVLATAAPVVVALVAVVAALVMDRIAKTQRRDEVEHLIAQGKQAYQMGEFAKAIVQYNAATKLTEGHPELEDQFRTARDQVKQAEMTGEIRDHADTLFRAAVPLRFRLIGFGGDLPSAARDLPDVLRYFFVLVNDNWTKRRELLLLDEPRRDRLFNEVNELLFLWVVALDRSNDPEAIRQAIDLCDRAIVYVEPKAPWTALRAWLNAHQAGRPAPRDAAPDRVSSEKTALACYQWGLLRALEGRRYEAIAWLTQAVRIEPSAYWYRYYLAYSYDSSEHLTDDAYTAAMKHYEAAFALRPDLPWVRFSRARLYRRRGAWWLALEDFRRALDDARALDVSARDPSFESQVRLEIGLARQSLGDASGARADYTAAIATDPKGDYARAARLNLVKLDAETGAVAAALDEVNALVSEYPDDPAFRQARAMLALRRRQPQVAEADLNHLLTQARSNTAELRALRALARLMLGHSSEAEADAAEAVRLDPIPSHQRLRTRTLLALGRARDLPLDPPEEWTRLPMAGRALFADLRLAAERLRSEPSESDAAAIRAMLTRAVILSVLGDPEAEIEASRAVAMAPLSARPFLVRSWVRHQRGAIDESMADVARGIALQPDNPHLWHQRGRLHVAMGASVAALADFDQALLHNAGGSVRGDRAAVLLALGAAEQAVRDGSLALAYDPDDPRAYLGRARAFLRLNQRDQALADLEQAAGWADGEPRLLVSIALTYLRCLPTHPEQLPRVVALLRQAWTAASRAPGS